MISSSSLGLYDDLLCGGVDVMEVVPLVNGIFILHVDVEILCRLSCVLWRLDLFFFFFFFFFFADRESGEERSHGVVGRMDDR